MLLFSFTILKNALRDPSSRRAKYFRCTTCIRVKNLRLVYAVTPRHTVLPTALSKERLPSETDDFPFPFVFQPTDELSFEKFLKNTNLFFAFMLQILLYHYILLQSKSQTIFQRFSIFAFNKSRISSKSRVFAVAFSSAMRSASAFSATAFSSAKRASSAFFASASAFCAL